MEGDKLFLYKTYRLANTIHDPADKKLLKGKIPVETKIILFIIPMLVVPAELWILFTMDN